MRRWYKKLNFSRKLLIILLTMILLPVTLLSMIEFYYSRSILLDKTNDYLKNLASVTLSKVQSTVSEVENVAFYINGNDTVQMSLKREGTLQNKRQEYYALYKDMRETLASYAFFRQEVNAIAIRSELGKEYVYTKIRNTDQIEITNYIEQKKQYWVVDEDHIILMKSLHGFPKQELLGYLALDVNAKSLYNIIKDIELSQNGKVFLVNENGQMIATGDEKRLGKPLRQEYLDCFGKEEAFYGDVIIDQTHYSVYNSAPISNGWHMMLAIPKDYYMKDISKLKSIVVLVSVITAGIAALLAIWISRNVTKPIRELSEAMEEFGQGNFEVNCTVDSEDEIGRLSLTFNQMVQDMNSIVKSVYEQKMLKQEAQMKSLQMQINPHFLYNTLDTINWMARIKQADEIGDMAAALGNMMRYSLAKKSFATIREEMKNLEDYLKIQNYRYEDKMEAKIVIMEELMDYFVPRLLIQPILENAIIHGMEEKLEKGSIIISARKEKEDLYIQVEDDGVGMTEEVLSQILNEEDSKKRGHTSIGIVNVNRRIQMIYGKQYGLMVQSSLGAGTKMTIHILAMTEAPD